MRLVYCCPFTRKELVFEPAAARFLVPAGVGSWVGISILFRNRKGGEKRWSKRLWYDLCFLKGTKLFLRMGKRAACILEKMEQGRQRGDFTVIGGSPEEHFRDGLCLVW